MSTVVLTTGSVVDLVLMLIIACEIGFWVVIVVGLLTRSLLRRRRLGAMLLATAPVVDVVLLVAVAIDLRGGATAQLSHSLAAIYIGVSIAYGHAMIGWADTRFAHRFNHGPAPQKLSGAAYTAKCWVDVLRTILAVAVAAGIVWLLRALVDDPLRTEALTQIYPVLAIWTAIDLIWALSFTIWPKKTVVPTR